ncbi:hypothetical protein RO575_22720 [Methylomonas sp. MO1]|uniref:hypothetical protein n=1 Tax=Methylomonas sp. MO1 TaxID=3073619 RepID=UPI0028A51C31|nr:hypothetical protein [Methylomonas sp. MO1]MDT4292389.1 hypothetical protein [Methylomonas sp. MO1]
MDIENHFIDNKPSSYELDLCHTDKESLSISISHTTLNLQYRITGGNNSFFLLSYFVDLNNNTGALELELKFTQDLISIGIEIFWDANQTKIHTWQFNNDNKIEDSNTTPFVSANDIEQGPIRIAYQVEPNIGLNIATECTLDVLSSTISVAMDVKNRSGVFALESKYLRTKLALPL